MFQSVTGAKIEDSFHGLLVTISVGFVPVRIGEGI